MGYVPDAEEKKNIRYLIGEQGGLHLFEYI